jgi:hypothetical protein
MTRLTAHNYETNAVESLAVVCREGFQISGIAIVGRYDFTRPFEVEMNALVSARLQVPCLVSDCNCDE